MRIGFAGLVGNTPLVRLNSMSEETGCEILAKVESANGGGSVKDRAALFLIRDAENKGLLRPGRSLKQDNNIIYCQIQFTKQKLV